MNIKAVHVCPPIPVTFCDWCAFDDDKFDEEYPVVGWGKTKQEAIADLLQQIEEANDDCA
jgi:hypothetical protein